MYNSPFSETVFYIQFILTPLFPSSVSRLCVCACVQVLRIEPRTIYICQKVVYHEATSPALHF